MKKITFFWSRIPQYAQACLRELQKHRDIEVYSLGPPPDFFKDQFIKFTVLEPEDEQFYTSCKKAVEASDIVVASGWMYPTFCRALLDARKKKKIHADRKSVV